MIYKQIHQNNHEKCILFMNGWACDEHPFQQLKSDEYDLVMCYDYRDILTPKQIERLFGSYQEVNLIAWSLGVYVANLLFNKYQSLFASCTAVNGTLSPIDNETGIPPAIFQGTIDGLNQRNLEKFQMRMCGGRNAFADFKEKAPQRQIEDQKEELISLQEVITNHQVDWNIYQKAIIGQKDLIFPAENQQKAWEGKCKTIQEEQFAHYFFSTIEKWDELLSFE